MLDVEFIPCQRFAPPNVGGGFIFEGNISPRSRTPEVLVNNTFIPLPISRGPLYHSTPIHTRTAVCLSTSPTVSPFSERTQGVKPLSPINEMQFFPEVEPEPAIIEASFSDDDFEVIQPSFSDEDDDNGNDGVGGIIPETVIMAESQPFQHQPSPVKPVAVTVTPVTPIAQHLNVKKPSLEKSRPSSASRTNSAFIRPDFTRDGRAKPLLQMRGNIPLSAAKPAETSKVVASPVPSTSKNQSSSPGKS